MTDGNGPDVTLPADWALEPALQDESSHTPWAEPGWQAWNNMSPELEFCEFAGTMVRLAKPAVVVETGVGQGFTTRRIARNLGGGRLVAYESDHPWRAMLRGLEFFRGATIELSEEPTPSEDQLRDAGLTVLDSDFSIRFEELRRWCRAAPPRALLLVHDSGNGHASRTGHARLRGLIEELGLTGTFLQNPRGSFLGVQG